MYYIVLKDGKFYKTSSYTLKKYVYYWNDEDGNTITTRKSNVKEITTNNPDC